MCILTKVTFIGQNICVLRKRLRLFLRNLPEMTKTWNEFTYHYQRSMLVSFTSQYMLFNSGLRLGLEFDCS